MSASLPRIKTVYELPKRGSMEVGGEGGKVKFRRLTLEEAGGQERRKSVKTIMSSRLNSLERYSNAQEQREVKNEKIHLNLIERKLLAGTYDERAETGNELTALKHRRDQMRVEMAGRQREAERVRALLEEVRQETQLLLSRKGEHEARLNELRTRAEAQQERAEAARELRSVFENMILARQEINMVLGKRCGLAVDEAGRLKAAAAAGETELREASERCAVQEAKLETLLKQATRDRQDRNAQISKHQDRITRRKDGEVLQAEKSRKYIAFLDDLERNSDRRDFKAVYDKILANLFVSRYAKMRMLDLRERYEKCEAAYNVVSAYRSFDPADPHSLLLRFLDHAPEAARLQEQIALKEQLQADLETRNAECRDTLQKALEEREEIEESFSVAHHAEKMTREREAVSALRREVEEAEEKAVRVKASVLRMLKELNQKADKRVYSGSQATLNNLTLLAAVLKEGFRQAQ